MAYMGHFRGGAYSAPVISSNVRAGDLLVADVECTNYLMRDGQTEFLPSDFALPAGWTYIGHSIVSRGGDPRRIAVFRITFARIADDATAGTPIPVRSVTPYYQQDQEPGTFNPSWDLQTPTLHGGGSFNGYWRGEKSIAAIDRATQATPIHTMSLLPGRSRIGGGSVVQFVVHEWHGGRWRRVDTNVTDADASHVGPVNPRVTTEGDSVPVYFWNAVWLGPDAGSYYWADKATGDLFAITTTTAAAPLDPVLTAPVNGSALDVEHDGVDVAWTYRAGLAGPQAGYQIRVATAGQPTRYWDAAAGALADAPVTNPGSLSGVHLPAAAFPAGTGKQHTIDVATCGSSQDLSVWSNAATVGGVLAPTATAAFVGADAGGVIASLRPQVQIGGAVGAAASALVAWSASLVDLTTGAEVANAAGVFDALSPASTVWAPNVEIANGSQVQASVRVQQTGGAWSAPATVTGSLDVDVPGAPTVTVTTSTHPVSGAPAVEVRTDFPWETDGYAWSARSTLLRLERFDVGGWVTVAETWLPPGVTSAVLDDYAAGAGDVVYRARGEGVAVDGSNLVGAWGESAPVALDVPGGWLLDPATPDAATRVELVTDGSRSQVLRSQRMAAIGRPDELVATGTPLLESGSLTVRVNDAGHRARVLDLLTSGAVLRFTFPAERDGAGGRYAAESLWFRPVGDVATDRVVDRGPWSLRTVAFDFVTQPPPVVKRVGA